MIHGMTKKIGISLRQELYDWAAREVEEGRAESVSALIAEGLELLESRAQLEAVVKDLRTEYEVGNPAAVLDGDIDGFLEAGIRWRNRKDDD